MTFKILFSSVIKQLAIDIMCNSHTHNIKIDITIIKKCFYSKKKIYARYIVCYRNENKETEVFIKDFILRMRNCCVFSANNYFHDSFDKFDSSNVLVLFLISIVDRVKKMRPLLQIE